MTQIVFIEHDGTEHTVEATDGVSVMQAALDNLVPGIMGECGGSLSCATCQGYIGEPWSALIEPPSPDEVEMLDNAVHVQPDSRLTCQIIVSPAIAGAVVRFPKSQV